MDNPIVVTVPTFVIGVGGVGNAIVRLVRERFLSSESGQVPPTVLLRSIDTAEQSEQATQARQLPEEAYTRLGQFNAGEVVAHLEQYPVVGQWWRYPTGAYSAGYIDAGAGARRCLGRLCFFQQFGRVTGSLRDDFRKVTTVGLQTALQRAGLPPARTTARVLVVGSLAGGTCSGMFIDLAIVARHLLRQEGFAEGGVKLTGVFALPSVIHLGSQDELTPAARQRRANTYAALRELDYLTSRTGDVRLRLEYPAPVGQLESTDAIYDQSYLVTSTKQGGVRFEKEEQVLLRCAHFIFGQIALGTGESTRQIMDNYSQFFDPTQRRVADGLSAVYGSFGVEWLEVPRGHLLAQWSREVGQRVGVQVADFEWDRQPRQDLNAALNQRFAESMAGYRRAIEFRSLGALGVDSSADVPDLDSLLRPISLARKPAELQAALNQFEVQAPPLLSGLRRSVSALPTPEQEDEWVAGLVEGLVADPGFRIGGAKRVLKAAEQTLAQLSVPDSAAEDSAQEVMRRCKRGLLGLGRVDPTAALEWARQRLFRLGCQVIRTEIGSRAARLAQRCNQRAEMLVAAQHVVRDEALHLGEDLASASTDALPREMWLLEPESIEQAITANLDEVTRKVADRVAGALGRMLARGTPGDPAGISTLTAEFRAVTTDAIRVAAAELTKRPQDALERLKGRMLACQPMAHVIDTGVDFLKVMKEDQRSTPVKMVVTGVAGPEGESLSAWAKREQVQAGDPNAFQVIGSGDPLRDDALSLSFGWPLCLFREVVGCAKEYELYRRDNPDQARLATVMNEVQGLEGHDVMPRERGAAESLFGVALALEHVKIPVLSEMVFVPEVFGQETRIDGSQPGLLAKAFERFYFHGLARTYEIHLRRLMQDAQGVERLRTDVTAALQVRRERIDRWRDELNVGPALVAGLERYYGLAETWARQLFTL